MTVRESWEKIEAWLAAHADGVRASLNPGASEAAIRRAEAALGVGLPDDFVQAWSVHDGQNWKARPQLIAGGSGSYPLAPLDRALELWETWTELLGSGSFDGAKAVAKGPVRAAWWNRRWFPVGVNGVGDLVCLDLDPPKRGKVGQVIEVLHEESERTVLAKSLGDWLAKFAADLEGGKYVTDHPDYNGLVHARDQ